jgi:predicted nucleotidyltransferase
LRHGATIHPNVRVTPDEIEEFCRGHQIVEFELFGSVLREDFGPESDVDVMVTFAPDSHHTLFDLGAMTDELETLFGRHVDLVERRGIEQSENYLRRRSILEGARRVYVAG